MDRQSLISQTDLEIQASTMHSQSTWLRQIMQLLIQLFEPVKYLKHLVGEGKISPQIKCIQTTANIELGAGSMGDKNNENILSIRGMSKSFGRNRFLTTSI